MSASEVVCSDDVGAESWQREDGPNNVARRLFTGGFTKGDRSSAEGTRCTAEIGLSVSASGCSFSDVGAES